MVISDRATAVLLFIAHALLQASLVPDSRPLPAQSAVRERINVKDRATPAPCAFAGSFCILVAHSFLCVVLLASCFSQGRISNLCQHRPKSSGGSTHLKSDCDPEQRPTCCEMPLERPVIHNYEGKVPLRTHSCQPATGKNSVCSGIGFRYAHKRIRKGLKYTSWWRVQHGP